MSVRVMSWVWDHSRSAPTQRLVLLAIADCANDLGTDAYPANSTLAAKTGLSERGVRKAVTELEVLGELQVSYKAGPRGCNRYTVIMLDPASRATNPEHGAGSYPAPHSGDPAPHSGDPAPRAKDPAPRAPKPSEPSLTIQEPSGATRTAPTTRGTRIPADFTATPDMIEWARTNTPLVGAKETLAFVDYWRGAPGGKGVKLDWPATWRNWMRKAQQDAERRPARASPNGLVEHGGLKVRPETAARLHDRARFEAMDAQQLAIEGTP